MKIRNGFVSNSSSSSFVIITEQIKELDEFFYYNGYFYCWEGNFEGIPISRNYINNLIRNGAIFIIDNLSFVSYNNEINLFEKVDVEVSENISYKIKFGMDFLYFKNTDVLKINILKKLKRREKLKKLNGEIIYYKNDDELLFKNTNFYINRIKDLWTDLNDKTILEDEK